jgi:hypothetical protein
LAFIEQELENALGKYFDHLLTTAALLEILVVHSHLQTIRESNKPDEDESIVR